MKQYLDLLKQILAKGEDVQSGAVLQSENRKPTCRFLFAQQLRFDLRDGFPAVTTKKLLFDWVVDEVLWFLRGETNVGTLGRRYWDDMTGESVFVQRPIWNQWAQPDGNVPHIYGENWRRWPYPVTDVSRPDTLGESRETRVAHWDQVAKLVADLLAVATDPSNRARRRIILTGWNPPVVPHMGLAPCHTLAQFLPTNGCLDCVCYWRSIDMFTGCPFNITQYALLTHIFAGVTGLIPRNLVCNIADCHLYDNQHEQVEEQCSRDPYPSPWLVIDPKFWETAPDLTIEQLRKVDPNWFRLEAYQCHRGKLKAEIAV